MRSVCIECGEWRYRVEATVVLCGRDISVCFGGGETQHIGAVALALPRPSLADPSTPSASASVLCVTGHKEDELAKAAALELATVFGCRVSITVGIHVDDATAYDIDRLNESYGHTLAKVKCWIADNRE